VAFEFIGAKASVFEIADRVGERLVPAGPGAKEIEGEVEQPKVASKEDQKPGGAQGLLAGLEGNACGVEDGDGSGGSREEQGAGEGALMAGADEFAP
jgi:hypothetical protein